MLGTVHLCFAASDNSILTESKFHDNESVRTSSFLAQSPHGTIIAFVVPYNFLP